MKKNIPMEYHSLKEAIHAAFGNHAEIFKTDRIHGGDINDTYRISLSTGKKAFVKTNSIRNTRFFLTESQGLLALRQTEAIGVPKVLGTGIDEQKGFSFLLLEWIESIPRIRNYWETFGYELANLHRAALFRAEEPQTDKYRHSYFRGTDGQPLLRYGFEEDNFIGANPQKNCPMASWIDFYRECRLTPQIKMAEHYLDSQLQRKITYLLDHLDSYLREPEFPSLLHGDLWSGNVLCGPDGKAWILDPAAYVGDFETDLAMTQLFGSFPSPFYSAYQEINPIDKGYEERKDLYHLYHLLYHLNLFGSSYLGSVAEILNGYI